MFEVLFQFLFMDAKFSTFSREREIPIITHLTNAYKVWHEFLPHLPKDARYTLGTKFDNALIEAIEAVFTAHYLPREQKVLPLRRATASLDITKFFLQLLWEIKALDNKKYIILSEKLDAIGRMLGGWLRRLTVENQSAPASHQPPK